MSAIPEKEQVLDIICETFDDNPMINFIIKNDHHRKKRIRRLAAYSYNRCKRRNGVFLSTDKLGVALCYRFNEKKNGLADIIDQLKLVFGVIGPSRAKEAAAREKYRNGIRLASGDFLYFWFLGVSKQSDGNQAARELRTTVFEESRRQQLPIYLETTLDKNRVVYERYGFQTIHEWQVPGAGITMWFMRREWDFGLNK